jgi:hypothetical protein
MNPQANVRGGKTVVSSNIYTALVAASLAVVLATAAFVAYKCFVQYGTIFTP